MQVLAAQEGWGFPQRIDLNFAAGWGLAVNYYLGRTTLDVFWKFR